MLVSHPDVQPLGQYPEVLRFRGETSLPVESFVRRAKLLSVGDAKIGALIAEPMWTNYLGRLAPGEQMLKALAKRRIGVRRKDVAN